MGISSYYKQKYMSGTQNAKNAEASGGFAPGPPHKLKWNDAPARALPGPEKQP